MEINGEQKANNKAVEGRAGRQLNVKYAFSLRLKHYAFFPSIAFCIFILSYPALS